jgi:hypothetical protein
VETSGNKIGRITPAGTITEFRVPTAASGPLLITPGSDGNLWFTEFIGNRIGRLPPAFVGISPGSGVLVTTQHFDLTFRVYPAGLGFVDGHILFDGAEVTTAVASCLVLGTRAAGGITVRCPGVSAGLFTPGFHTLGVSATFTDGSVVSDSVTWQIETNHEP